MKKHCLLKTFKTFYDKQLNILLLFLLLIGLHANCFSQNKSISNIKVDQVTPEEPILPGFVDQQILKVTFEVTAGNGSLVFKNLKVTSLCTNEDNISKVNLYKTAGATFVDPIKVSTNSVTFLNDTLRLQLDENLDPGNYYFWVTMDIKNAIPPNEIVDAKIEAKGMGFYSTIDGWKLLPDTEISPSEERIVNNLYYTENFEKLLPSSAVPVGWSNEVVQKAIGAPSYNLWRIINGGYNPSGIPNGGSPPKAKSGLGNACFQIQDRNYITKLVTKKLNLQFATNPILKFWHAQTTWPSSGHDRLKVYYKCSSSHPWQLLATYEDAAESWTERKILLNSDSLSNDYYIAFEGISDYGFGSCVDSMVIHETALTERSISQIVVNKPSNGAVPQGSAKNIAMRLDFYVKGNTSNLLLDSLRVKYLGNRDADIKPNSFRLYHTLDSVINYKTPVGSGTSVENKNIRFTGLNFKLPSGYSAIWITFDVANDAVPGNILDTKIEAQSISVNGNKFPSTELNAAGNFNVVQSIFGDGFETIRGWYLSGEFERGQPQGKGGQSGGYADPQTAYAGLNVLGVDLSTDGNYQSNLSDRNNFNKATSPPINCRNFKNVRFQFQKYLNAEYADSSFIEYKFGLSPWYILWRPTSISADDSWKLVNINMSDSLDRKDAVQFRFILGPTDGLTNMSGWNIDEFFLTGDSIPFDAAVVECTSPRSSCGLSSTESVTVKIKNIGPQNLVNTPIMYSLDNGANWITEYISSTISPDASLDYTFTNKANLSKPGYYKILIKTAYPNDGENRNDTMSFSLISYPTIIPPYKNDLQTDTSYWIPGGTNSSWFHTTHPLMNSLVFKTYYPYEANSSMYHYNENSYLESPCFNLTSLAKPIFEFDFVDSTETGKDGALLYYSIDGGSSWNYYPQKTHSYPWQWYNNAIESAGNLYGFTGNSKGIVNARNFVPDAVIGKNNVKLRLVFRSNDSNYGLSAVTFDGFSIDNIKLYEAPADLTPVSIDNLDKTGDQYCQFEHDGILKVTLRNLTERQLTPADTVLMGVKINNNLAFIDTFNLSSNIPINGTQQFTFKKKANIVSPGTYNLKVFVKEKHPGFYGSVNDTIAENISVVANPITSLPDTLYTANRDTLEISTISNVDYNYEWKYNAVVISDQNQISASTTGFGKHYLNVTSSSTGCLTKDSLLIMELIPDVGVDSILSPGNDCGYKLPLHPVIRIKNFGTDTMRVNQTIPVKIKLNNGSLLSEIITLTKKFAPDSSYVTTLTSTLNLMTAKTDTIKIWTDLATDNLNDNDTTVKTFRIYGYPHVFLGNDTVIKDKLTYDLDAGSGYKSIIWNDGKTTTQKFTISRPGYYSVSVTDDNDCVNSDTIHVHLSIHDLSMQKLVSPIDACSQPDSTAIICQIKNTGSDTILITEPIILFYQSNNGSIYQDTIYRFLKPDDSLQYTFRKKLSMSQKGDYDFKLKAILAHDRYPSNDNILSKVKVYGNPLVDLGANRIIHQQSYTIDPGNFKNYLWQDNTTDSVWTITKEKFQPGNIYSVTVTDENGCTDRDSVSLFLVINDLAVTEAILPPIRCSMSNNEVINLKITNSGNAPLNNQLVEVSYSLNGGPEIKDNLTFSGAVGAYMIHTFSTPVNMSAKGKYSFKMKVNLPVDINHINDTATYATQVLGFPDVDFKAPNDTFMVKLPYTLHAGPGYSEYLWQDNSTDSIFTVTKDNYVPSKPEYKVIVTDVNGCTVTESVNIIVAMPDLAITNMNIPLANCTLSPVKPGITIKNNSNVSITNQEIKLSYKLNDNTEVTKLTTVSLAKGVSQTLEFDSEANLSAKGTYNLTVTLTYPDDVNIADNSKAYEIKVFGNPVVNFGVPGDTVRCNSFPYSIDAGEGYKSYKWNNNTTDRYLNANAEGWYSVLVTTTNECSAKDSLFIRNTTSTGSLTEKATISLYPNPVSNYLYISVKLEKKQNLTMEIISANGKVVYMKKFENMNEYRDEVDVSGLPKGFYYVRFYDDELVEAKKIVVK